MAGAQDAAPRRRQHIGDRADDPDRLQGINHSNDEKTWATGKNLRSYDLAIPRAAQAINKFMMNGCRESVIDVIYIYEHTEGNNEHDT